MDERELDRRIAAAAGTIVVPGRPLRAARATPARAISMAVTVTTAVLFGALVLAQQVVLWHGLTAASAGPINTQDRSGAFSLSSSPSPSAALLSVAIDSDALGYRLRLPAGFRRSECLSSGTTTDAMGVDSFTSLSEDAERSLDRARLSGGGAVAQWVLSVTTYPDVGMSAVEVARSDGCPACGVMTRSDIQIEAVSLRNREVARTVVDGEARQIVVRAEGRLFVIGLHANPSDQTPRPITLPVGVLDAVAQTLEPIPAVSRPSRAPLRVTAAAQTIAQQLADAFASRDTAALRRLATPRCWLEVSASRAAPVNRAPEVYVAEIASRMRTNALVVRVDPHVLLAPDRSPGGLSVFVRSQWDEGGVSSIVDLYLTEIEGAWYWAGVNQHDP